MTILESAPAIVSPPPLPPVELLELEVTRSCALKCIMCYSNSGPAAKPGKMTSADWMSVIDQAAGHDDIRTVQFIGGEPTDHPVFMELARHALTRGLRVAVYTNLLDVTEEEWDLYADSRVSLSASWYSADPVEHARITREPGAFDRTWANLCEARRRGLTVKIGVVKALEEQDVDGAVAMLTGIGIDDVNIDGARPVGRAAPRGRLTSDDDLCGGCGRGRAAVDGDGWLMPCVLGRHRLAGNVRQFPLAELLDAPAWERMVRSIHGHGTCTPADSNDCDPSR